MAAPARSGDGYDSDRDWFEDKPSAAAAPRQSTPLSLSATPGRGKCQDCPADGVLLFQRPGHGSVSRVICGKCQGRASRVRADAITETIRNLKATAVLKNPDEERRLVRQLAGLVGADQAEQTAAAIGQSLSSQPSSKEGRRR